MHADLAMRLTHVTPADTVKGWILNGLCRAVEEHAPPGPERTALVERHRRAPWQELANVPVSEAIALIDDGRALIAPKEGGDDEALRLLGLGAGRFFLRTVVARVATTLGGGKDPIDLLSYGPTIYAPSASYGTRRFTRLSATVGRFSITREFFPPAYHQGLVRSGVCFNGHTCTIEVERAEGLDMDLLVTWDGQPPVRTSAP